MCLKLRGTTLGRLYCIQIALPATIAANRLLFLVVSFFSWSDVSFSSGRITRRVMLTCMQPAVNKVNGSCFRTTSEAVNVSQSLSTPARPSKRTASLCFSLSQLPLSTYFKMLPEGQVGVFRSVAHVKVSRMGG
jgi:hypothetical protein